MTGFSAPSVRRRYETVWLPLLADAVAKGTANKLLPPLDVLYISYIHRIDPAAFKRDCSYVAGPETASFARDIRVRHYSSPSTPRTPTSLPTIPLGGKAPRFRKRLAYSAAAWQKWVAQHGADEQGRAEPYSPLYFTGKEAPKPGAPARAHAALRFLHAHNQNDGGAMHTMQARDWMSKRTP
jgi:hypothetical protein